MKSTLIMSKISRNKYFKHFLCCNSPIYFHPSVYYRKWDIFMPLKYASVYSESTIKMTVTVCLYGHTKYRYYISKAPSRFFTREE